MAWESGLRLLVSKPFRYFWFILAEALLPVGRVLIRLRCRAAGYGRHEEGNCCFLGPPEFLVLCSKAMEQLSKLDWPLHQSLVSQKLRFWYEPHGPAVFAGHFGISEGFVAWREQGVIACALRAHFEARLAHGRPLWSRLRPEPHVVRERINAAVRAWLGEHEFPVELVGCFD